MTIQTAISEGEMVRVGLVLIGEISNIPALRMLLLHLNTLQSRILFELLPGPRDIEGDSLAQVELFALVAEDEAEDDRVEKVLVTFASDYESKLVAIEREEDCHQHERLGYIVISMCRLAEGYFALDDERVVLLALGDWKAKMAPPSIVEFVVTLVVGGVGQLLVKDREWSHHYGTRGCIFDYADDLAEARYQVLEGLVCQDCERILRGRGIDDEVIQALRTMASREWLLRPAGNQLSPASVASALGHDLFLTKGLEPSAWQKLRGFMTEEATREGVKLVFAIAFAYLVFRLSWKT